MKQGSDMEKDKRKRANKRKELFCLIDDDLAFVPVENIRIIEYVIDNLEEVKQRINRIKSIEN